MRGLEKRVLDFCFKIGLDSNGTIENGVFSARLRMLPRLKFDKLKLLWTLSEREVCYSQDIMVIANMHLLLGFKSKETLLVAPSICTLQGRKKVSRHFQACSAFALV